MSKTWVNFKVLCGWSGCGHPACVRLKVAEIAGLGVGREGGGGRHRQSIPGSHLALPVLGGQALPFLCLSFQEEASHQMEHPPTHTPQGVRAWSAGQEGPGALSVRASACMLALLVLGRQWKWLPGLFLGKSTRGLASQYSGKGLGRGALDTKGSWSAADPKSDPSVLSFDK